MVTSWASASLKTQAQEKRKSALVIQNELRKCTYYINQFCRDRPMSYQKRFIGDGMKSVHQIELSELGMDKPEPLRDPPNCIKCGEKMWFSCTELEKPGFVHHVYECKKCRSTQS